MMAGPRQATAVEHPEKDECEAEGPACVELAYYSR